MSSASTNGDILSQALFQTGLSTPVKVEPNDSNVFFSMPGDSDFLTSDIQDMVGGLTSYSSLPDTSHQQNVFPVVNSSVGMVNSGRYTTGISTPNSLVPTTSSACGSQAQYRGNISGSTGMIPMKQENSVAVDSTPVDGGGFLSSTTNVKTEPFNDYDIDLGDLLSIPTPDIGVESNSISQSVPQSHSNYAMTSQVRPQAPFPAPAVSSLEFQPSPAADNMASDLPVLDDIFGILGDNEADFLDTLGSNSGMGNANTSFTAPMVPRQLNTSSFFGTTSSGSLFPSSSRVHTKPGPYLPTSNMCIGGDVRQPHPLVNRGGSFVPQLSKKPSFNRTVFKGSPMPSSISSSSSDIKQVCTKGSMTDYYLMFFMAYFRGQIVIGCKVVT